MLQIQNRLDRFYAYLELNKVGRISDKTLLNQCGVDAIENDRDKFYAYLELWKMGKINNKTLLDLFDIDSVEEQRRIDKEAAGKEE